VIDGLSEGLLVRHSPRHYAPPDVLVFLFGGPGRPPEPRKGLFMIQGLPHILSPLFLCTGASPQGLFRFFSPQYTRLYPKLVGFGFFFFILHPRVWSGSVRNSFEVFFLPKINFPFSQLKSERPLRHRVSFHPVFPHRQAIPEWLRDPELNSAGSKGSASLFP